MDNQEQSTKTRRRCFVLCVAWHLSIYSHHAWANCATIKRGIVLNLSDIVASKCRQRILRVLSHLGEIRLMRLAEKTGCGYNELMRNVRILEREGVVIYRRDGRKCFVSLNRDSIKARILIKALRILDAPINSRQPRREKDNGILRDDKRLGTSNDTTSEENEDHVFYGQFGVFCASTSNLIVEVSKA